MSSVAPFRAAGGVPSPRANLVLHTGTPVLAVVDLLLVAPDRDRPVLRLPPQRRR